MLRLDPLGEVRPCVLDRFVQPLARLRLQNGASASLLGVGCCSRMQVCPALLIDGVLHADPYSLSTRALEQVLSLAHTVFTCA